MLIVVSDLVAGRAIPVPGTRRAAVEGALLMGAGCLAMSGLVSAHLTDLVPTLVAGLSVTGFGSGWL